MKKITLKVWTILLSLCVFAGANAAERVFSLNDVQRSNGDLITYEPATGTATFAADANWQYVGWVFDGIDLSAYDWIFAEFDASGLPDFGDGNDPNKLQFAIVYSNGEVNNELRVKNNCAAIKIDKTRGTAVNQIFLKVQNGGGGTLVLKRVWAATFDDAELPLWGLTNYEIYNGEAMALFDVTTATATIEQDWRWVAWDFNQLRNSKDFSAFTHFVVELAEPNAQNFVVVFEYDGGGEFDPGAVDVTGESYFEFELPENKNFQRVILKGLAGDLVLDKVYFTSDTNVGINTPTSDDVTVIGYYSITGVKLSVEPASGIFIIKYSNGKAVKVVK